MKLEKIAQLLDIASNNNSNNSPSLNKGFTSSNSSSDILSYNIVAGETQLSFLFMKKKEDLY
jgi:hypothetical protein